MTRVPATLVRPGLALLFLVVGIVAHLAGQSPVSATIWLAGLVLVGLPEVARTLWRAFHGHLASDIIAMLAILGSLALGQPLAGLIVVLMQTGGEALERYAEGRASRAIHELEQSAPRIAHRIRGNAVEDLAAEQIAVGDILLVRPGELVPCDGVVASGRPLLDLSRLTGEPLPVSAEPGTLIRSGSHNLESPFELRSTTLASESGYARIVELVRSAQASKAPLQRLADRYAIWFTPLTLLACGATFVATHDLLRVLAVLVVATPCPLILATPVAVVGGISRAASRGIIFRHGAALEQLGGVTVAVFDKTGTLTVGLPDVAGIRTVPGRQENDVMSLAAAVERGSGHLLARTIVSAAERHQLPSLVATGVTEAPGQGVTGTVGTHEVSVGGWRWISTMHPYIAKDFERLQHQGSAGGLSAFVAIDRHGAGIIDYADRLRPEVGALVAELRQLGVGRTLLLSGDRESNVRQVAAALGVDEAHGDLAPEDKTRIVQALVSAGETVVMVGDGTNDAPALSAATVGIALASGGGGIAAEAADAVILADDPSRVAEAIRISRRSLRIAHQSIWTGLVLSACAMGFAAAGALPPAIGAMLQEAIDVAVIVNALRAAVRPRKHGMEFG
jgi:heavy metal translocating P-type ATPase